MIQKKLLLVLALTVISCTGYSVPGVDASKAMVIDGVIARGNIIPLGVEMLRRVEAGQDEVHLIINSPGGEVTTGFLFLNLMKAAQSKGLKVKCYVPTIAASMAYQILLNCDERFTLNHAFLLWHRARINVGGMMGAPMTGPQLATLGRDLESLDSQIFGDVLKYMGKDVTADVLSYHFEAETLHTGLNLHILAPRFILTASSIPGLMEALLDRETIFRNQTLDRRALAEADYIYITDKVERN